MTTGLARFVARRRAMQLSHIHRPFIQRIARMGTYIVLRYIRGMNLAEWFSQVSISGGE